MPNGVSLEYGSIEFQNYEHVGLRLIKDAAFVLTAGGLGERLGYSGIKVALTSENATQSCFLKQYIESILQYEKISNDVAAVSSAERTHIPLAIMTSDDTHERTQQLLEAHHNFGMDTSALTLIKQDKVACFIDNEARFALEAHNKYQLQTKPHGHGDVHVLLHSSGLLNKWLKSGVKWVIFFQDTNALFFKAVPSALGVSKQLDLEVNSLAVPRTAKEAIGAICELSKPQTGEKMTINVEYNQLDSVLRASGFAQGDVADPKTGFSEFPGNINELIFKLEPYELTLRRTGGLTPEFVNPKYKDAEKTIFVTSARYYLRVICSKTF